MKREGILLAARARGRVRLRATPWPGLGSRAAVFVADGASLADLGRRHGIDGEAAPSTFGTGPRSGDSLRLAFDVLYSNARWSVLPDRRDDRSRARRPSGAIAPRGVPRPVLVSSSSPAASSSVGFPELASGGRGREPDRALHGCDHLLATVALPSAPASVGEAGRITVTAGRLARGGGDRRRPAPRVPARRAAEGARFPSAETASGWRRGRAGSSTSSSGAATRPARRRSCSRGSGAASRREVQPDGCGRWKVSTTASTRTRRAEIASRRHAARVSTRDSRSTRSPAPRTMTRL